jgi:hypothetical protein
MGDGGWRLMQYISVVVVVVEGGRVIGDADWGSIGDCRVRGTWGREDVVGLGLGVDRSAQVGVCGLFWER